MKKLLISLILLSAIGVHASEDIPLNMKNMRDGMILIQDGFLYNKKESILSGITKIQQANSIFQDAKCAEAILPSEKKKYATIAYISAKNLNMYLIKMKDFIDENSTVNAADAYSGVIHSCTHCHAITRGW